jgi:hypothetical protein
VKFVECEYTTKKRKEGRKKKGGKPLVTMFLYNFFIKKWVLRTKIKVGIKLSGTICLELRASPVCSSGSAGAFQSRSIGHSANKNK